MIEYKTHTFFLIPCPVKNRETQFMVSIPPSLSIQQLLDDTHQVSGIILGAGDRGVHKTEKVFAPLEPGI